MDELKKLYLGEFVTIYKELDDFVNTKTKKGKVIDPKDGPKLKQLEDRFSIAFDAFFQIVLKSKS